ncbi:hypothetical protein ABBQ38_008010 [Trebouxia sp. C0009 RCD-2024]
MNLQHSATSFLRTASTAWTDIAVAVALGTSISWVAKLLFGLSYSSVPLCIILALRCARAAKTHDQATAQLQIMHSHQVEGLKAALNKQQEEHLAVMRKMKLEQNQVLLKCHELQRSLRP